MQKHRVAVAEKTIPLGDRLGVGAQHAFAAAGAARLRERAYQHQQRGLGQVKIGEQRIDNLELVRWVDENVRPAMLRFDRRAAGGQPALALLAAAGGGAAAAGTGVLALRWLLTLVEQRRFHWFAPYCGVVGLALLVL